MHRHVEHAGIGEEDVLGPVAVVGVVVDHADPLAPLGEGRRRDRDVVE